jgi:hypothetical protein
MLPILPEYWTFPWGGISGGPVVSQIYFDLKWYFWQEPEWAEKGYGT